MMKSPDEQHVPLFLALDGTWMGSCSGVVDSGEFCCVLDELPDDDTD